MNKELILLKEFFKNSTDFEKYYFKLLINCYYYSFKQAINIIYGMREEKTK